MLTSATVDRARLRQEAVEQVGVFGRLHADREAEILARLLGDLRDRGDRRPAWRSMMSLMFCAQMVGKPVSAPEPAAMPAERGAALQEPPREYAAPVG